MTFPGNGRRLSWALGLMLLATQPVRATAQSERDATAPAPIAVDSSGTRERLLVHRRLWLDPAQEGSYIAPDKLLHASLVYASGLTLRISGASRPASLGFAAGLGVAKELHDCLLRDPGPNQGISRRDLVADGVGVALAALAMHFWLR